MISIKTAQSRLACMHLKHNSCRARCPTSDICVELLKDRRQLITGRLATHPDKKLVKSTNHWVIYSMEWAYNRHKLSLTLATAHYSSSDNAIGLVAQCELGGYRYVKLGSWVEIFTQTWQPCYSRSRKMAVHWRHCGLRRPKLTPVSLISTIDWKFSTWTFKIQ